MRVTTGGITFLAFATLISADLTGLRFYLYTKSNKNIPVQIKSSDLNGLKNSIFVTNKTTKILCHGYTANYLEEFPRDLKNVYLGLSDSYNVIAIDWAQLASIPYETAAKNARAVGKEIANLINALISVGKSHLGDFHFIGHSLGGQVGAFISKNLDEGQNIPRVTGLDPARPGFNASTTSPDERLDPSDADFVDIIRSSPGGVGSGSSEADPPSGSVDFYPNGGLNQPGCIDGALCSHLRAYKYYTESVTTTVGFKAYKCDSYVGFKNSCARTNPVYMGEHTSHSESHGARAPIYLHFQTKPTVLLLLIYSSSLLSICLFVQTLK